MHAQKDLITAHNLTRVYHQGEVLVTALQNITLSINSGEFIAIVGPSGSGKTTLLNMIGGLDTPSEGHVALSGTNIDLMSQRQLSQTRRDHIGFIFQFFNLIPVLTVEENTEYVMLLQGISADERKRRVRAILKGVGLEGLENRYPHQLSGGQQQRVAICRAMVAEPSIILADEPTANVDSATGQELLSVMEKLNAEKGMTFLFSTHDRMIRERAKRIIRLQDGKVESDG